MDRLVESVPNISEGADVATLSAIATAFESIPGAWLLDQTADIDHGRSVFTLAGEEDAVKGALEAGMAVALDRIDMRGQSGRHPRIGAVDVVPFIPLGESSMTDVTATARRFAEHVARRFDLPVYLYAAAASRPDRRILANVRRPTFEGLASAMATSEGMPDFGPGHPHATAGATAVGSRPFLIAWNIQFEGRDAQAVRRLATAVRERDGGLPGVQALGLELPALDCVQLSMNILDHAVTPLWRVWEEVARLASEGRMRVIDSELIGLLPSAALEAVADHIGMSGSAATVDRHTAAGTWLGIRGFDPDMTVEARLDRLRTA